MALDPAKPLDIDAIEAALDELLERYRQALRAVELLPKWGPMPNSEYLHTDRIRSHLAARCLARMFLRSHIQSKLHTIAERLEIERFASGHMDANTSKRLDNIIRKLRTYDKFFIKRKTFWSRVPGWIWRISAVVVPAVATYFLPFLRSLTAPSVTVTFSVVLVYIAIYLLYVVLWVWFPLFVVGALGGFHSKRLILLGQTGNINIDIASNAVLRWVPGPRANTYEAENRFFGTLGLSKPEEFPWDLVLAPPPFLSTALILASFMVVLAFNISTKEPGLTILIIDAFFVALLFLYLRFILRPIFRAMRERRQRSAC